MLHFTRWKAFAIILASVVICLMTVPSLLPPATFQSLPSALQRRLVLGLDLQGGSHILLEVDSNAVRRERAYALRDEVRSGVREARVVYSNLAIQNLTVQVRVREEADVPEAVRRLRELSSPLGGFLSGTGQRDIEVTDAGGGLITLTIPPGGITQRIRQAVEQSIEIVRRRVDELGTVEPLIQRQGDDRILVQVPGLQDPSRLKSLLGKTAKLAFRLVDLSMPVQQALEGRAPPESDVLYSNDRPPQPYLIEKRVIITGEELVDAQPGFDQRTREPIVSFRFNNQGARRFAQVTQENVGRPFAI